MSSAGSGLRYPGGKTRAIKILSKYIPSKCKIFVSPFIGGGSFELYLTKFGYVYGYDIFKPLVIYWQQLIANPDALADRILEYHSKPINKEVFLNYRNKLIEYKSLNLDELNIASLFFILNRSSFSGTTMSGGFSKEAGSKRFTKSSIEKIRTNNILSSNDDKKSNLSVECKDFEQVFNELILNNQQNRDDLLIFADPPYVLAKSLYGINGEGQNINHELLRNLITKFPKFLITYDDCELVRNLYADYTILQIDWSYGMNSSKKSNEVIILSDAVLMDLWMENAIAFGETS